MLRVFVSYYLIWIIYFSSGLHPPGLITIARSSLDGYTLPQSSILGPPFLSEPIVWTEENKKTEDNLNQLNPEPPFQVEIYKRRRLSVTEDVPEAVGGNALNGASGTRSISSPASTSAARRASTFSAGVTGMPSFAINTPHSMEGGTALDNETSRGAKDCELQVHVDDIESAVLDALNRLYGPLSVNRAYQEDSDVSGR